MGVLNVTPDSFSDGGRWADPEAAVAHARELIAQGADIIDIGGESPRPGAQRVDIDTEISRVLPVVRALLADGAGSADGTGAAGSAIVSVDTIHAATAEAAIDAGAHIINDVSGGLADPAMHDLIARTGVVYVCQHWRGDPETMDRLTDYPGGVVAESRPSCASAWPSWTPPGWTAPRWSWTPASASPRPTPSPGNCWPPPRASSRTWGGPS